MNSNKTNIRLTVEKTTTGFSAYCEAYPVYTTGKSFTELQSNAVEAINLFLSDQALQITKKDVVFEIDLKQFFQFYRVINAKFLAQRIGMNETLLSQYVKGRKKPSITQTSRILSGIQEIGQELSSIKNFL